MSTSSDRGPEQQFQVGDRVYFVAHEPGTDGDGNVGVVTGPGRGDSMLVKWDDYPDHDLYYLPEELAHVR